MKTDPTPNQQGPDQLAPCGGLPSADLLACPFCGHTPELEEFEPHPGAYAEFALPDFTIHCQCGIRMSAKGSHWEMGKGTIDDSVAAKASLVSRWNTRHANTDFRQPETKENTSAND